MFVQTITVKWKHLEKIDGYSVQYRKGNQMNGDICTVEISNATKWFKIRGLFFITFSWPICPHWLPMNTKFII